jgi:hypothetical protein
MLKIFTCFFLIATTTVHVIAQAPVIKWQKTYGGTKNDDLLPGSKTTLIDRDGKYLIGCTTSSDDGDMIGNHSSQTALYYKDAWVAKVDSPGNKRWSTCLGYAYNENISALKLANDSGYITIGSASSSSPARALPKIWVTRLNDSGNVIWQKKYGGTYNEEGKGIAAIPDGYILAGITTSDDGDIGSTYHGTPGIVNYSYDIWVAKLNNEGGIVWKKCLGGYGVDNAREIKPTADGGFIVAGTTTGSGGDVTGSHGGVEIWIVKLDGNGNLQWQKCLGGSSNEDIHDIELLPDGGYIITGQTISSDGDVTGYHVTDTTLITTDAWVARLSPTGDLLWQKCFGGSRDDVFYDIQLLPDNNFAAVGTTTSTNGDVSHNNGKKDCWLVKFDPTGNIIWEKTFGTANNETGNTVTALPSGNLLITANTYSQPASVNDPSLTDVWLFEVGPLDAGGGALPLTWLSFRAMQNNGEVNVVWETSQEYKVHHFEVQRSANNIDFTPIGTVEPGYTHYQYNDKQPLQGVNYYRVKSVDIDGALSYSTIATVNIKEGANIISSLYPNPGNGNITLQLQGNVQGKVFMQVIDQYGRTVLTKQLGNQHTTRFITPVNLSVLPKGNYILKVLLGDRTYLNKLVIQ